MQRLPHSAALLLSAPLLLAACNAEYKDISSNDTYRETIGVNCEIKLPLNAYGVTLKLEKDKKTDLVVISDLNLRGPEFTFSTVLNSGTRLQVLAVQRCINCPFETRIEYRVLVTPAPAQFTNKPVYLNAAIFSSSQLACKAAKSAA
jgi:hypothetical protein